MQTTTILFATTSLLAALSSAQKTVVYTGQPEQYRPAFTLNPTESSLISKYASDIAATRSAQATGPFGSAYNEYLATVSARPTALQSLISNALQGNPVPTNNAVETDLPASLREPLFSGYNAIASAAKTDLTADPALSTVAPYYVEPAEASDVEKITVVEYDSTSTSSKMPKATGTASKGFATVTGGSAGTARGTAGAAGPSGSGFVKGTAGASGSSGLSGSGVASGSASGGRVPPAPSATSSPITSAKASTGGASERVSVGVGALLVVGMGVVAVL